MKSYVAKLQALLSPAPPKKPCDWQAIERELGVSLPEDFKEFWRPLWARLSRVSGY